MVSQLGRLRDLAGHTGALVFHYAARDGSEHVRVELIQTEGRGGAAEIEADGLRLRVVDHVSLADRRAARGPVEFARLEVIVIPHLTSPAAGDGPDALEPDHGWRYRAAARIVATDPVFAEVGPLRFELRLARDLAWAVGDRVDVAIDRIILTRAND